ncbi:hypothetical protein [Pseudomonas sp.]|uniref:hypothetical protein n=1 Tax=Pseudomonas sp. TaxID=306 RepID=UPI003D6E06AC
MRTRGQKYWDWADVHLHCRTHEEALSDGTTFDIQARLSRTGATQMFIGVYAASGDAIREEVYAKRPGENITRALAWGVERARHIASKGTSAAA